MSTRIHCKGNSMKRKRLEVKRKRRAKLLKSFKRVFLGKPGENETEAE